MTKKRCDGKGEGAGHGALGGRKEVQGARGGRGMGTRQARGQREAGNGGNGAGRGARGSRKNRAKLPGGRSRLGYTV